MNGQLIFRNLRGRDITSKSDPMCVLFMQEDLKSKFVEVSSLTMVSVTIYNAFL